MKYFFLDSFPPRMPSSRAPWQLDIPVSVSQLCRNDKNRVRKWDKRLTVVFPDLFLPFDYATVGIEEVPIFSPKLQEFFLDFDASLVQFLPVQLQRDDGKFGVEGYALGKFLQTVDCIDRKRTRVDDNDWTPADSGDFNTFGTIFLDRSRLGSHICSRIEGAASLIICRGDFRDKLERCNFIGFSFEPARLTGTDR